MDKEKLYNKIIQNRIDNPLSLEVYGETHHIIPRCLGGSNLKKNLVRLTAREHYICHYLLSEMYKPNTFKWYKMQMAFIMMNCISTSHENRYINSRLYELKKLDISKAMSFNQSGSRNSNFGKPRSEETKMKIRNSVMVAQGNYTGISKIDLKKQQKRINSEVKIFRNTKFNFKRRTAFSKIFNLDLNSNFDLNIQLIYNQIYKLYVIDEKTTTEIGHIYNICHASVSRIMGFLNIERRQTNVKGYKNGFKVK